MSPSAASTRFGQIPGLAVLAALLVASQSVLSAWTPGTGSPAATSGFVVDTANRRDVLAYFNTVYPASENYASHLNWTGSTTNGIAGTTSAAFKDDVRRRINFYRALAGWPGDITLDATKSGKDQEAALMYSANNALSHDPPSSWTYYTANADDAAGHSNISLGNYGPGAVDGFVRDDGGNNTIVGHRRWLLYSAAAIMGTGDVPSNGGFPSANAIWVIGDFKAAPAPRFVPWPNSGYVPVGLVPARWSLSYPGANFSAASVTMTRGAATIPTTIISNADNGYGDNTLVWTPTGIPGTVAADTTYTVAVSAISGSGIPTSFTYTVTLFDPNVLGESVAITGSGSPPTTGGNYSFNSIAQADSYELKVSTGSSAAWTEGAEDSPAPQIAAGTTGSYALRQTSLVRTGSKAFHLAFPNFNDQSFTVTRDILAGASSHLQFYERGRFATTTTTLDAEISTDNGSTWTSLWSRNGAGLNSAQWDANWVSHSVSLAAYAGQIAQVRFIMRRNGGSIVVSTATSDGFFLDDITISNATELVNSTATTLAGNATSFTLNGTTAGAALVAGTSYWMRIRPNVGTHWFDYGPFKMVTPIAALSPLATTLAASNVVFNGATLKGTVNPNGLAATAHFEYGLTTAYGTSTAAQNAGAGTSAAPVQAVIGNLTPNTTYHYRVVATNSSGTKDGLDGTFTTPDEAVVGTWAERTVMRSLPTVGSEVDIGTLTFTGGTGSIEAAVNATGSGWSVAKRYVIPIRYNLGNGSPPATWLKVLPTHDTGPYGVNDFDLDINVTNATVQMRLRTVGSNGNAATARIAIKTTGLQTFANSIGTAPVPVLPTQTVGGNAVNELSGKAGIGAAPSANAVLDINGGDTRGLHLRPRSVPGAPTAGTWNMGTIILDSSADLFICTAPGTPGTWMKIGAP